VDPPMPPPSSRGPVAASKGALHGALCMPAYSTRRWLPLTLNFSFELFLATSSI
jgi:hypothetical protein